MCESLVLNKMSLVVTTRCNLNCKLCDEFIPMNKPFSDMTIDQEKRILEKLFEVVDNVNLLHLSGGGEPFLHPKLAEMIRVVFEYQAHFDKLMTFTNSMILPSDALLDMLSRYKERIIVQASDYGIDSERSQQVHDLIKKTGVNLRINKYYGEQQDFGGWVDFGSWDAHRRSPDELDAVFSNCGITKHMQGNWRTRDGKVHWCQRSQRGMELGILADNPSDYVDLFSHDSIESKREKFATITTGHLSACDHCSGDHGTEDETKRFHAGEQLGRQ